MDSKTARRWGLLRPLIPLCMGLLAWSPCPAAPGAPGSFWGQAGGQDMITVRWTHWGWGMGFRVVARSNQGFQVRTVSIWERSCTFTGLQPDTTLNCEVVTLGFSQSVSPPAYCTVRTPPAPRPTQPIVLHVKSVNGLRAHCHVEDDGATGSGYGLLVWDQGGGPKFKDLRQAGRGLPPRSSFRVGLPPRAVWKLCVVADFGKADERRSNVVEVSSGPEVFESPSGPPSGPPECREGDPYEYVSGRGSSNGHGDADSGTTHHDLVYQFAWGDGTESGWTTGRAVHVFTRPGAFAIRSRVRCSTHPDQPPSPWSSDRRVQVKARPPPGPTDLTARALNHHTIQLAWRNGPGDRDALVILRRNAGLDLQVIDRVPPHTTHYVAKDLAPQTLYCFVVRAVAGEQSADSNGSCAATWPAPPPPPPPPPGPTPSPPPPPCDHHTACSGPAAPTNLVVRSINARETEFSWKDNSDDETGFVLEIRAFKSSWMEFVRVRADLTRFTIRCAPRGAEYRIRAVKVPRSDPSNVVALAAGPPPPPRGPTPDPVRASSAEVVAGDPFTLSWQPVPGAASYVLQGDRGPHDGDRDRGAKVGNVTSITRVEDHPGEHFYRVQAVDALDHPVGDWSAPARVRVRPR